MSRFRFTYGDHDFGWQRHVCIDDPTHRQCLRFVHPPRKGRRRSYMRMVVEARKKLRRWLRDEAHIRSRQRLRGRLRS